MRQLERVWTEPSNSTAGLLLVVAGNKGSHTTVHNMRQRCVCLQGCGGECGYVVVGVGCVMTQTVAGALLGSLMLGGDHVGMGRGAWRALRAVGRGEGTLSTAAAAKSE